ncbi:hypothetical protein COHA_009243 [Chlorella ohadii]|uniref:Uncharacterized protein n=1 Tax=Chlorella ohadii TaxID=2649997 RepID=A0AAD5DIQ5_9CHLO|nr:hypothetical protein COHA_009243 [Chlorella ohadii]
MIRKPPLSTLPSSQLATSCSCKSISATANRRVSSRQQARKCVGRPQEQQEQQEEEEEEQQQQQQQQRTLRRFGRLGKRAAGGMRMDSVGSDGSEAVLMRDPRHLWLSVDEACSHVGANAFRLVAGIYDASGAKLLGTAVSPPIR